MNSWTRNLLISHKFEISLTFIALFTDTVCQF